MKRWFSLLLAAALLFSLSGCGLKEAVQSKTREVLEARGAEKSAVSEDGITEKSHTGTTPSGQPRPLAPLPEGASYEERLEYEWQNAPNEGYVWTITIKDTDEIDAMGLCTATYNVNLSASHVGKDMFGPYFGEFGFDYSADMGGLSALLTAQGGSVDYDTDGWFQNDRFLFELSPYEKDEEEMMEAIVNGGSEYEEMSSEEKAMMEALLGQVYDLDNEEPFEKNSEAAAMWWAFDMPMTDGDMSGYFQMNGILGGIVDGKSEIDSAGKNVVADVRVAFGLYDLSSGAMLYKFDERYSESDTFENPIPYTLKVYPDNNVVMTLYSSQGGPVTTKCYGTIDKVPVEQTTVVKP
ncbi:hypothetical protein [Diplocloster modestus]|uniref:Uncharacterized protein n=1 Tax=Diplocloster modestus TaxID=2850322 RepID=A0ABS6KD81_9FIRM|nr:hypothetical protein [Diplocloster modestus]MBU9728456.1 hypothetical protein [Diplocloster modestus]